jgi:hypothetical protein
VNLLTVRRLPVQLNNEGAQPYKLRLDPALAKLVQDNLQLRHPSVRVGKRFAVEFALQEWLYSRGLVRNDPGVALERNRSDRHD